MLEEVTKKYDYFISQQDEKIKRTFDMATKDPLTGLYNRQYLSEYAKQAIDRTKRHDSNLILIFIDIDNFKYVNDNFGHEEGDKVLKRVGDIFRKSFRKYDVLVRYGGDEFIVFLEEKKYNETEIMKNLDQLVQRIEKSLGKFKISASYGCSFSPKEADNIQDLIKLADERMYSQKKKKKCYMS
jgi:diguanylate cyclase (GGDEF)-like protein